MHPGFSIDKVFNVFKDGGLRWLPRSTADRLLSAVCCLLLLFCCGCGTGEYERRLEQRRVSSVRKEQKFGGLYAPQDVPGTKLSVRIPQMFKDQPLVEGAGKPVDARRVKPDKLVTIPGLKLTYEGFVEGDQGVKLPYYCYVGAVDATPDQMAVGRFADPSAKMRAELAALPQHEMLTNWESFQGDTPDGRENPWMKLRFVGNQEFVTIDKTGQEQFATLPGVLEICLRAESGYAIVIAWRMPISIEKNVNLAKWIGLVAGCVSAKK